MVYNDALSRAPPESVGVRSVDIEDFLDDAVTSEVELHSFMLFRSGSVIAEGWWFPYRPELPHMLHSATKSFLSVAVGIAIHEGYFSLDDKVVSFFPDHLPKEPSDNLTCMTVEDLVTQTSGHGHGESGGEWREIETSWIDKFFSIPVEHKPGSVFAYSSATSFMLSAIISKTTGLLVREFLEPRFFRPLGIKALEWDVGPEQINPGGNGISCFGSDFLKLGILHLQKGMWNGQQILPADWVDSATKPQRGNPHGYHWWTDPAGLYCARGMFGQLCVVFPEQDAVLMTMGSVGRGSAPLRDLVARHFPRILSSSQLMETPAEREKLATRLGKLNLLKPLNHVETPAWVRLVSMERFVTRPNEDDVISFSLNFEDKNCIFHLQDKRGFHQVLVGLGRWLEGETTMTGAKLHHGYEPARLRVVASGHWVASDCFEMILVYNETAFRDTATITFTDSYRVASLARSVNVNSFGTRRPIIHGVAIHEVDDIKKLQAISSTATYSTTTTTVGELLDNPTTRAILEDEIPEVLKNPRLDHARKYTFDVFVHHVEGMTVEDLARIDEKLSALAK
jgi:hypothetical protein